MLHVSTHECNGRPWSCSITLVSPTILWFFVSTTTFCCGFWGVVISLRMSSFTQKYLKSFETYSPSLSLLRASTFLSISFSTSENASSFFHMKKIEHFLEKSSVKIKKYLCLTMEVVEKFPQTSKRTLSKSACALLSESWNVDFTYFPKV